MRKGAVSKTVLLDIYYIDKFPVHHASRITEDRAIVGGGRGSGGPPDTALLAGVTSDLGSLVLVHSVGRGGAMLPSTVPYGKGKHAQGAAGSLRAC